MTLCNATWWSEVSHLQPTSIKSEKYQTAALSFQFQPCFRFLLLYKLIFILHFQYQCKLFVSFFWIFSTFLWCFKQFNFCSDDSELLSQFKVCIFKVFVTFLRNKIKCYWTQRKLRDVFYSGFWVFLLMMVSCRWKKSHMTSCPDTSGRRNRWPSAALSDGCHGYRLLNERLLNRGSLCVLQEDEENRFVVSAAGTNTSFTEKVKLTPEKVILKLMRQNKDQHILPGLWLEYFYKWFWVFEQFSIVSVAVNK